MQTGISQRLLRGCGVAALVALSVGTSPAADTVVVRTPGGSVVTRTGTVLDYTASELRLRPAAGRDIVLPADQIVRIETVRTAAHGEAEALFAQQHWKEAAERFADAIRGDERPWVRREMLARLVRCYRALGDGDSAGKVFLQLAKGSPTGDQFASMPLAWRAVDPLVVSPSQARAWLDAPNDRVANLLAASHLLTSADAAEALDVLERLASDRDPRVALLAEVQRWRTSRAGLDETELARRRNVVERIEAPLRGGPYFILGQTLLAAGRTDEAVATLLRVPTDYADESTLSAAAVAEAVAALRVARRTEEASALARESKQEHSESDEATRTVR